MWLPNTEWNLCAIKNTNSNIYISKTINSELFIYLIFIHYRAYIFFVEMASFQRQWSVIGMNQHLTSLHFDYHAWHILQLPIRFCSMHTKVKWYLTKTWDMTRYWFDEILTTERIRKSCFFAFLQMSVFFSWCHLCTKLSHREIALYILTPFGKF